MQQGPSNEKSNRLPPRFLGARFELGRVAQTRGVANEVPTIEVLIALARHVRGDWGDMDAEDCQANEDALLHGGRVLSAYWLSVDAENQVRVYIITEADRSATTVLLPEEY